MITPRVQPSFLDRAIARVAPGYALQRYQSRVQFEAAQLFFGPGGYNGARLDRPATKSWLPRRGSANSDTIPDLLALRARCADLERNDPLAAGAMATMATHTVGTGIVPHARLDRDLLQLSDEDATAWERQADRIFHWWAETKACDYTGRQDFYGQQSLVLRGAFGRGDIFALRRFEDRPGALLSTRVQLIEADRVCNPRGMFNSTTLMDGIELDANGRPAAVHVLDRHPGDTLGGYAGLYATYPDANWTRVPMAGAGSGDPQVLHVYEMLRPDQARGVPKFAPIIETLKQLSRLSDAELMAAVIQSFFTVFLKSTSGEVLMPDMGDPGGVPQNTAGLGAQNDVRLGQGAIVGLAPGEEPVMAQPNRPNPNFDPFYQSFVRQVGVAIEMPYEVLIKHFSSSYSASRGAILEAWRAVLNRRDWMVRNFCQPTREWIITEAIARGLLIAPGYFENPLVRMAYLGCEWTGTAMGQLDPESEINAAKKRVDLGVSTIDEETAQLTGGDWDQKHAQRVKERRLRLEGNLEEPFQTLAGAPAAATEPPTRAARDRQEALSG
ncbi:MAG: hypothetical protein JWO05_1155 [Gemmatimonadetes bacterium]|nr:hypothetical protein [Gemmatimonadota bacterium]